MIKSLIFTFSLLFSQTVYAAECTVGTEKSFFTTVEKQKVLVLTLSNEDQIKFTTFYNSVKLNKLSTGAKTYFGVLGNGMVGVVVMQDGCIVKGTIETIPGQALIAMLGSVNINVNDLVKYDLGTTI